MNLDYDILWIDDRPRQINDVKEHIQNRLARKGFDLKVKMLQHPGDDKSLQRQFNSRDFDLLVVDFKMQPDERNGDDLIRSIRRFCDTTDIVFYSSETPSALRAKIDVDGVYCANRNHLKDTLDHVIHSTIKKVLDLNSMRGISLAQLADFDHAIDKAISSGYEKLIARGIESGVVEEMCETASSFHSNTHEKITNMPKDQHISEYTSLLSSNPKYTTLIKILNLLDSEELDRCSQRISNYENEIIVPRNQLAHAMEKKFESGNYILESRSREIKFTEGDFTMLRVKLLDYRDQLQQINEIIDRL